jgi:RecJ-like exonuclease
VEQLRGAVEVVSVDHHFAQELVADQEVVEIGAGVIPTSVTGAGGGLSAGG